MLELTVMLLNKIVRKMLLNIFDMGIDFVFQAKLNTLTTFRDEKASFLESTSWRIFHAGISKVLMHQMLW